MQILPVLRRNATLYGICATHEESDVRFKYVQNIVIVIFTFLLCLLISFTMAEVLHQLQIGDTFLCLFASAQLVSSLSAIGSYVSIILQMKNIRNIFNELQNIFDKCKFSENQIVFMKFYSTHFNLFFSQTKGRHQLYSICAPANRLNISLNSLEFV